MKTIIHDLENFELDDSKFSNDIKIVNASKCNNGCIGCFSCWIKHPKKCAIKDEFSSIVDLLSQSDELILISNCRYGCYSHSVKRVLERCIGYVLPYFTIRNGEIHHACRYKKNIKLTLYLYGVIDEEDKKCIDRLMRANTINLNAISYKYKIFKNKEEIIKCIL